VLLLLALGLVWLTTAEPVPLYDGVGFPDEPYRFVPARGSGPAATSAQVELKVAAGSNTGGLIVNTREAGPQASVFAPPHAFAAAGTAPIVLAVRPVPPQPPLPDGVPESNVYVLSLTSAAGPVTVVRDAQPPAITMRAVTVQTPLPLFHYRPTPTEPWQELKTRQVGRDIYNAVAPGPGEYVLIRAAAGPSKQSESGRGGLYAVLGATVLLMAGILIGVRLLARKSPPA
jgi:hypothetical protein